MLKVPDWRKISNGTVIPTEYYSDQPYIVKTEDGAWLCVVTTGAGHEGQEGQHIVALRSLDHGETWSKPVDVESTDGPESSYAVLLKAPSGRVFCFYNHNTDNVRKVTADISVWSPEGYFKRVDSLGHFVFKYSDDYGKTWSHKRYDIPVRDFECDRNNPYKGEMKFFWNVGKPFIYDNNAFVPLAKVGGFGYGFYTSSEGVLIRSDNLLTERNVEKITWKTLPEGEIGIRIRENGKISEEHSFVTLSDGSFYCVFRTIDGHPACSYSRHGGDTWETAQYKRYADNRLIRHPRAANFVWRCENGKYLYWFHNHGGTWYSDRNPVWICGGIEADGPDGKVIQWTQPEILLYDDDIFIRISYPDFIEDGGKYYISETQKCIARIHKIPTEFIERLWGQFEIREVAQRELVLEMGGKDALVPDEISMPELPVFLQRDTSSVDECTVNLCTGFTIEFWAVFNNLEKGQRILDSRDENGQGLYIGIADKNTVEIVLNDGRNENRWSCDQGMMESGKLHHIAIIVDGGPKIISFIIDAKINDGSGYRQFGWGRFSPNLQHANGEKKARVGAEGNTDILLLRIYGAALTTTEVIGNYRYGIYNSSK